MMFSKVTSIGLTIGLELDSSEGKDGSTKRLDLVSVS